MCPPLKPPQSGEWTEVRHTADTLLLRGRQNRETGDNTGVGEGDRFENEGDGTDNPAW